MPTKSDLPGKSAFLSVLVVSLGVICGCKRGEKSPVVEPEVPEKKAAKVGLRVTVAQLKKIAGSASVRVLDARSKEAYDAGHLPGAVHVDVAAWKAQALKDEGAGLTAQPDWEKLIRALGIDELTQVVVYADNAPTAARIWWTLKYLGVEDAGILDGGWSKWTQDGGEVSTKSPTVKTGNFTVDFDKSRLAQFDQLKAEYKSKNIQIIDTRSPGEFQAGHLPGATHLEWKELLNPDGTFKSDEELKKIFAGRKIDPDKTAVTHCQTGGRASVDAYALELAGFKNVKNYYCGWSLWSEKKAPVVKKP